MKACVQTQSMRATLLPIEKTMTMKPVKISAGKPTVKMFKLGAARATKPKPMLINSKVIMTGKAISKAPKNIIELQLIILPSMSWLKNGCPIGMSLNDSNTCSTSISRSWPRPTCGSSTI